MKAKALALCEIKGPGRAVRWRDDRGLMNFLKSLQWLVMWSSNLARGPPSGTPEVIRA
jgi:hypothetical protein